MARKAAKKVEKPKRKKLTPEDQLEIVFDEPTVEECNSLRDAFKASHPRKDNCMHEYTMYTAMLAKENAR